MLVYTCTVFGLLGFVSSVAAASLEVAAAASNFFPAAVWQSASTINGDFSCHRRKEFAILGTSKKEIVVAVFLDGLKKKPKLLQYSAEIRSADSAVLTIESLDFKVEDFKKEIGPLPRGLIPSKTCVGLNMSDQLIDSAHIYWNRKARRFDDWVR